MKVTQIGNNRTEIETCSGTRVLVSYSTPVAAWLPGEGFIRTSKKWSVTTSRHVNQWLDGRDAATVSQARLDSLID